MTCHYPKKGAGVVVVNAQPIVITFFVTTRGEGEGVEMVGPMSLYMSFFCVDGIPNPVCNSQCLLNIHLLVRECFAYLKHIFLSKSIKEIVHQKESTKSRVVSTLLIL